MIQSRVVQECRNGNDSRVTSGHQGAEENGRADHLGKKESNRIIVEQESICGIPYKSAKGLKLQSRTVIIGLKQSRRFKKKMEEIL
jgi:hypothetical protein